MIQFEQVCIFKLILFNRKAQTQDVFVNLLHWKNSEFETKMLYDCKSFQAAGRLFRANKHFFFCIKTHPKFVLYFFIKF